MIFKHIMNIRNTNELRVLVAKIGLTFLVGEESVRMDK